MNNLLKTSESTQLYDYYKEILTEKQRQYFELYYFEDLTLQEISEELGVSRNAVHDSISKTMNLLNDLESKLKLMKKSEIIKKGLDDYKNKKITIDNLNDIIEREL
ncbi:hypothetical protein SHELI_v1c07550 [Spiroplasma helicoides]|uniref:UPF0122 protein SHELI_v1c07550 n=1 Tax=Spiroplasma helicoides TaxID=216938 RepID=A0A1B3SL94_9MOLU|nr:sigma factor-like helix-turn-helix DNA-binding protein [Spiroplasma helicoides]AOG60704.1 hypothetical protein SHELI_v1c07550 [Spiroplasma helicoides]